MDSLEQRFKRLSPHITHYGPDDNMPRPAVVLFHGCGGLRPHVRLYAQAVALLGVRAYVVDSFAPRGWGRTFAISLVCTGAVMHGYERAGDVLAVLWGLKQSGRVAMDQIILSGFSHGGWAIMDLMTAPLVRSGEVKIKDPDPSLVANIRGLYLVYPYINVPARTNLLPWLRQPKTLAAVAEKDHLTPAGHVRNIAAKLGKQGVEFDILSLDATHAFDEEDNKGVVMAYSHDASQASIEGLLHFAKERFNL
jgi:dienelactone hydrolase